MGIIVIARGSCERGKQIAENLAEKMGYDCSSKEILLKNSKQDGPPKKLMPEKIQDDSSICNSVNNDNREDTTFTREAFLKYLQGDNVVYHSYSSHLFIREIPNIFKIKIIATVDYRVKLLIEKDNISEERARQRIYDIDVERWKWESYLYGLDKNDDELYDLVLKIDCLGVNDLVDFIYKVAGYPCFQSTPETRLKLKQMHAAARAYHSSSSEI